MGTGVYIPEKECAVIRSMLWTLIAPDGVPEGDRQVMMVIIEALKPGDFVRKVSFEMNQVGLNEQEKVYFKEPD